jgi:hypothetical protein
LKSGNLVERRGTKTIKKIAQIAVHRGFKTALLGIDANSKSLKCRELKISMDGADRPHWKYSSKTVTLDLDG